MEKVTYSHYSWLRVISTVCMVRFQSLKTRKVWCVTTVVTCLGTVLAGEANVSPQDYFVDTSILAAPYADEVIIDVPSAFHWSRYQQGKLGEFTYTIYPDGSAKVMYGTDRLTEKARIECVAARMCTVAMADGTDFTVPVERGLRPALLDAFNERSAATYLAQWILMGTAPEIIAVPQEAAPEQPENEPFETGSLNGDSAISQPAIEPANTLTQVSNDTVDTINDPDAIGVADENEGNSASLDGTPNDAPQDPVEDVAVVRSDEGVDRPAEIECDEVDPFFPELCTGPKSQQPIVLEPSAPPVVVPNIEPTGAMPQLATAIVVEPEAEPVPEDEGWSLADLNCSVTASASLAGLDSGNAKPRVSLGCGTQITDRLSFRGALVGYAIPNHKEDFDPDFTYAFTYKFNDRINLGYSNYLGSFSNSDGALAGLLEGNLRASFELPDISLPNESSLPCTASIGLPDPTASSLNLSCGYAVTPDLRVGATAYVYLSGEQDEFSPDYSYTVSYRINENWRLSYNNYSNNRFPWNRGESPGPGLTGGSISLSHKIEF